MPICELVHATPAWLLALLPCLPCPAQKVPDLRLDHGPATATALRPQIAASGATLYATWEDARNGQRDVYFNSSSDGGESWLPTDVRINTTTGAFGSGDQVIAASGSRVYIAYNGDGGVRFNRSLDGGSTWLPSDVLLAPLGSSFPIIACAGATVWVVYHRTTALPFNYDLFVQRSLDSGTSWQSPIRLDTDAPEAGDSLDPRLVVFGSAVHVVWRDKRSGLADVYYNRSLDGGATWLASDVRINTGVLPGTSDAYYNAELAVSGATVYVVWWDDRNSPGQIRRDVFVKRSLDQGTTWPALPTRLDTDAPGTAESHFPHIAATGSSAVVVWSELRNGDGDVYYSRTSDNGATWLAKDIKLDHGAPGITSGFTYIVAAGGAYYLTFYDTRLGGTALFWNRSLDGGVTWLPIDLQLQRGPAVTPLALQDMTVSGSSVYVVWDDSRSGVRHSYFNIPFGAQPYGVAQQGSGGFAPNIGVSGQVVGGSTVSIDVTKGLGGAAGALLVGGPGTRVSFPVLGGTLLVLSVLQISFACGGATGVPGVGTYSLPVFIAPDPVLIGADLYVQPALLDPGAAYGIAIGNAVAMWIG